MHPEPTKEQQELMEAVERFCREQITPERLAAWEREPRGVDERSWRAMAELGWFGLGLPESAGGSGLGSGWHNTDDWDGTFITTGAGRVPNAFGLGKLRR